MPDDSTKSGEAHALTALIRAADGAFANTLPSEEGETSPGAVDVEIGCEVGGYVLEERVGSGGFATVFRAREAGSPDGPETPRVAVKVLHTGLTLASASIARFRREVEALGQVGHPNIVSLLGTGEIGGRPYVILEFVEGRTLEQEVLVRGALSIAEVVSIFDELCPAVATAHQIGIVHRDIKAANIVISMTDDGPRLKLLDFGIVKVLNPDAAENLTSTGMLVGSPINMAPEQISGGAIDERTDVYALGILLYQLVTGRLPFDAKTSIELCNLHLNAPPPHACDVAPVPGPIDLVIRRALSKDPAERHPSVEAFLEALRSARQGCGDEANAVPVRAVVLRVEWRVGDGEDLAHDDDLDDEVLDDIDCILDTFEEVCDAEQLEVASNTGNLLLALRVLSENNDAADAARDEVVQIGARLAAQLRDRDDARVDAAVSVRVGIVTVREESGGGRSYVGADHVSELAGSVEVSDASGDPSDRRKFSTGATVAYRRGHDGTEADD